MEAQIRAYIETIQEIITEVQSGFRTGYNCSTPLLQLTNDVTFALLDCTRVFDHGTLLSILHYVGFDMSAVSLVMNYSYGRHRIVKLPYRQLSNDVRTLAISIHYAHLNIVGCVKIVCFNVCR